MFVVSGNNVSFLNSSYLSILWTVFKQKQLGSLSMPELLFCGCLSTGWLIGFSGSYSKLWADEDLH